MNKIFLHTLFALLFAGSAANLSAQGLEKSKDRSVGSSRISSKYDKSKNITTVRMKEIPITRLIQEKDVANNIPTHQMDFEAYFTYSGQQMTTEISDVTLRFHAVCSNYLFLRGQQIIVALNREFPGEDKGLVLGMTDYESYAPKFNSVYEEFMTIKVPTKVLARMATAKSTEIYVGPVAYKLSKEQLGYLSALTEMLAPEQPAKQ